MDELSQMLSGILDSPEGMEKLKTVAESLFNSREEPAKPKENSNEISDIFGGISPNEISGIMTVARELKKQNNDSRTNLLLSLRPYLSCERQRRLDEAVKILRLINLMPLIKKSGIF